MPYATLAQVQAENKIDIVQNAVSPEYVTGNNYLIQAIDYVTRRIDQETQNTFEPYKDIRYFDADRDYVDFYLNQLLLDRPLLEAIEVKVLNHPLIEWDGDPVTYNASDYFLSRRNLSPYYVLQGIPYIQPWNPYLYGSSLNFVQAFLQCISVSGIWGFRQQYTREGWKSSGDVVQTGGIDATQTVIPVSDINGVQYNNQSPRFSQGQLLKITTDLIEEYIQVVDTNLVDETITVIRGVRGTDAAIHDEADDIKIWYPQPEIARCTTRWVVYLYQRRAVYDKVQLQMGSGGQYSVTFPPDIPDECQNILELFRNQSPMSIKI